MHFKEKQAFIGDNIEKYSLIPLSGKSKVPEIKGWNRFSYEKSTFAENDLLENNYGIVTGPASNLLVLDVDNIDLFDEYIKNNGFTYPDTFTVQTGKGYHYYFEYPDDTDKYTCKSFKKFGFDFRGWGGYVVGPYSYHEEAGKYYKIYSDKEIAPAPEWVKNIYSDKSEPKDSPFKKVKNKEIVSLIENGEVRGKRSEAIFRVLMSLVSYGYDKQDIFTIFQNYPIGEKYLEKPENIRDSWLDTQITKAKEEVTREDYIGNTTQVISDNNKTPIISSVSGKDLISKNYEIEWIIDGLIEKYGHTLITGKSGIGKSLFSLNLALALASSPESGFMGRKIKKGLKVAIIQCENSEMHMSDRMKKICDQNATYKDNCKNVHLIKFNGHHDSPDFKFSSEDIESTIEKIYLQIKPDVLIIDPYKSYSGVPENDNDRNREILDRLFFILKQYDITAIIIHHEGKSMEYEGTSRSRGASTITDTVSNHWSIVRDKEKKLIKIRCEKSRNYQKFGTISLGIIDDLYFVYNESNIDFSLLVNLMKKKGSPIETQRELINILKSVYDSGELKCRYIIDEAIKNKIISSESYGQNKKRYTLV